VGRRWRLENETEVGCVEQTDFASVSSINSRRPHLWHCCTFGTVCQQNSPQQGQCQFLRNIHNPICSKYRIICNCICLSWPCLHIDSNFCNLSLKLCLWQDEYVINMSFVIIIIIIIISIISIKNMSYYGTNWFQGAKISQRNCKYTQHKARICVVAWNI